MSLIVDEPMSPDEGRWSCGSKKEWMHMCPRPRSGIIDAVARSPGGLLTFALASLSGLLATVAVGGVDAPLLLYPGYFAAMNAAIAMVIWRRRRVVEPVVTDA